MLFGDHIDQRTRVKDMGTPTPFVDRVFDNGIGIPSGKEIELSSFRFATPSNIRNRSLVQRFKVQRFKVRG